MSPRVSVIVPTRDRREKLGRALDGVEAQRFRDFEVVIVDDASTDGTLPWLAARWPDVRALAMAHPAGAAAARNRAVEHARGELLAFLDDDDRWRPEYLEAQVGLLDAVPEADLSYADNVETDARGRHARPDARPLVSYPSPLVWLLAECFIHTLSAVVCRRAAFDRVGGFDERLAVVHDLDWYGRILADGGSIAHVAAPLVERGVPGGLVEAHRRWFEEECLVRARAFARCPAARDSERLVAVYRCLFFARTGLGKGDLVFGLRRLAEAFARSPVWALRIAALRVGRRIGIDAGPEATAWDAAGSVAR